MQGSGSGIYTMNIARELVKEGNDVFVIDIDNQYDTSDYSFQRRTILCDESKNENPDLKFNFPCFTTHPRSVMTYYDMSDDQIDEYVATFVKITGNVALEFKPDVIHAQHLWITPYAALKSGVPYVITVHGTDLMGFRKDKRYHKYALEGTVGASKIITISRQVHNDTLELYKINEKQLILNSNGFDNEIFKIKNVDKNELFKKLKIDPIPQKLISFVGKFTDFKGIDILIRAAKIITDKIPTTVFAFAGDGQLMPDMKKLKENLKLNNVHFLGHQNQIDVSSLYNVADVSVVPSRIEPFGLVAIEAMACGTPVVATRAGGLPDFVNDEVGQLVEMENSQALADAIIEELMNNTKQTKGKYAAKYALENYSWNKTLKRVIGIYKEAIR